MLMAGSAGTALALARSLLPLLARVPSLRCLRSNPLKEVRVGTCQYYFACITPFIHQTVPSLQFLLLVICGLAFYSLSH